MLGIVFHLVFYHLLFEFCYQWAWCSSLLSETVVISASAPNLRQAAEFLMNAVTTLRKVLFLLRNSAGFLNSIL